MALPASFTPPAAPKTDLGHLRVLSPTCGLRVSPLQLGGMSIGEAWSGVMGSMDKETSFALLDTFWEAGGNFIDTANNYQEEESEKWIGEWMKARGNRDELVIATKFTTMFRPSSSRRQNYSGNHAKSLKLSLEASLAKLQTSYVDILYLHWLDHVTSIEEIMQALNRVVLSGQVLYLGISDTPAWVVAKANMYARAHGLAQFVIYQGKWNVLERDFERDIIPMARDFQMALAPWSALGGGKFQTAADIKKKEEQGEKVRDITGAGQSEAEKKISLALDKVGQELGGKRPTAVALAYVMAKAPFVFPIVGGRKVEHLKENIDALSIRFTKKHIEDLEAAGSFQTGFPHDMIGSRPGGIFLSPAAGAMDWSTPHWPVSITAPRE